MTITKDYNRQGLSVAHVDIEMSDLVSDTESAVVMDIPPNAIIDSGRLITTEAWNSTSTDVIDVGDSLDPNRYLNNGNIRALAANVPLVPTGYTTVGNGLTVTWTSGGGTPTTGTVRLEVKYFVLGRASATLG